MTLNTSASTNRFYRPPSPPPAKTTSHWNSNAPSPPPPSPENLYSTLLSPWICLVWAPHRSGECSSCYLAGLVCPGGDALTPGVGWREVGVRCTRAWDAWDVFSRMRLRVDAFLSLSPGADFVPYKCNLWTSSHPLEVLHGIKRRIVYVCKQWKGQYIGRIENGWN